MPGRRNLPSIWTMWPDVTAIIKEWQKFIERCDSWAFGPGIEVEDNDGGRTVNLRLPPGASVAKTNEVIDAMTGSTPGSGTITLYSFDGTTLTAGEETIGFNTQADTVADDAWVQVKRIDGYWFIDVERCVP